MIMHNVVYYIEEKLFCINFSPKNKVKVKPEKQLKVFTLRAEATFLSFDSLKIL